MILHVLALTGFVLLLPLAGMLVLRTAAAVSTARRARRERAHLERLAGQGLLVVKGTLRVEEPLERTGGRALGCRQTTSSARRFWFKRTVPFERKRATKLSVVAGDRRYELSGAIHLLSGSRVVFSGGRAAAWNPGGFAVDEELFEDDEVIVAGTAGAAKEGSAYRDTGEEAIEPAEEGGGVFVCAAAMPTTRVLPKALVRHFSLLLLAIVGCYPLYGFARSYGNTECAESCKSHGRCEIQSVFQLKDVWAALRNVRDGRHVECAASSDELCRASADCSEYGACSVKDGDCQALTAADCELSSVCFDLGWCSPVEGSCRAVTAEDCAPTEMCLSYGHCVPGDGSCRDTSEEACRGLRECTEDGHCGVLDGRCAATAPEHCAATEGCEQYGRCSPVSGRCQPVSDADCQRSDACREQGFCSLVDGVCLAKTDADCVGTRRCAEARECKAQEGACVEDARSCRESAACKHWGACAGDVLCSAGSKADCAKAEVCRGKTDCRPLGTSCATSCEETESCRRYGFCSRTAKDECVADSDKACAASKMCREIGFCTHHEGRCERTSTADCQKSDRCKYRGLCTFVDGDCKVMPKDCTATPGCKLAGRCSLDASYFALRCAVRSDDDCKNSEVCQKRGWCTRVRARFSIEESCGPAPR